MVGDENELSPTYPVNTIGRSRSHYAKLPRAQDRKSSNQYTGSDIRELLNDSVDPLPLICNTTIMDHSVSKSEIALKTKDT